MTEKNKPAPEKTDSTTKQEPVAQPVDTTPVDKGEATVMLVPEEPSGPAVKG
jgi:hypothetical protein